MYANKRWQIEIITLALKYLSYGLSSLPSNQANVVVGWVEWKTKRKEKLKWLLILVNEAK